MAPNMQNKLPDSLKITENLNTYKRRVQKHVFHRMSMRKTVFIIISIVYHDSYLPIIIIIILIIAIFVLFLVYFSKKSFLVLFLPLQLV